MAHKYSSFDSAYAAAGVSFNQVYVHLISCSNQLGFAEEDVAASAWGAAITHTISAIRFLRDAVFDVGDYTEADYQQSHLYESLYWANKDVPVVEEYELTFEKIVEAWIADDFAGRALTIAVIDRMRQLIWDEPFNIVWAARPENTE